MSREKPSREVARPVTVIGASTPCHHRSASRSINLSAYAAARVPDSRRRRPAPRRPRSRGLAGYRLFKLVLGVYGFHARRRHGQFPGGFGRDLVMVTSAHLGGLLGALIWWRPTSSASRSSGAGIGRWRSTSCGCRSEDPQPVVVIIRRCRWGARRAGPAALRDHRGTAFGGAWTAIVGAWRCARAPRGRPTRRGLPIRPAWRSRWVIVSLWLALSLVGVVVQFASRGAGSRRAPKARKKNNK